eukprot:TRINITY_DN11765_c0_g1_i1.p2 TRINITY_DN11765_c0_g1~~TRINITY_DN11765_c0_g1_i1.p2  ORF type:complete len:345 (+),score=89.46 TRINITY_DN11765_c0_g1_i1:96-1037(+)
MATFNNGQKLAEETEAAIVKAALDAGINTFDTAEGYGSGESERALAKALDRAGAKREDIVIASKVLPKNFEPAKLREACERSVKNLGTHIDLYQLHWPNWDVDMKPVFETLAQLQAEGHIRLVGVSNFGVKDLGDNVTHGVKVVSNQLPYSLLMRQIETAGIRDACVQHKAGIMCYSALSQGLLTGKYSSPDQCPDGLSRSRHFRKDRSSKCRHTDDGCEEEVFKAIADIKTIAQGVSDATMADVSLAWALAQPGVTCVVVGASKPEHVTSNARAAQLKLSEDIIKALDDASEPVKAALGDNPDMWGGSSRYR